MHQSCEIELETIDFEDEIEETVTRRRPSSIPAPRPCLPPPPALPSIQPPPRTLPPPPALPRSATTECRSLPPPPALPAIPKPAPRTLPPPPVLPRSAKTACRSLPPPSLPPPPRPVLQRRLEPTEALPLPLTRRAIEREQRSSIAPVVQPARESRVRLAWHESPIAIGAFAGFVLFFVIALIATTLGRSAVAATSTKDDLVVTISGPSGRSVANPVIAIDGVRRCEASPCRVGGLREGVVFVSVEAEGFAPTAPRAVRITPGTAAALHIELTHDLPAVAWTEPAAAEDVPTPNPEPPASEPAPRVRSGAAARKPQSFARLSFASTPPAAVILDGTPLGFTPRLGVRVEPGPHQVVFQHAELGRRSQTINVAAGQQRTVGIQF